MRQRERFISEIAGPSIGLTQNKKEQESKTGTKGERLTLKMGNCLDDNEARVWCRIEEGKKKRRERKERRVGIGRGKGVRELDRVESRP